MNLDGARLAVVAERDKSSVDVSSDEGPSVKITVAPCFLSETTSRLISNSPYAVIGDDEVDLNVVLQKFGREE